MSYSTCSSSSGLHWLLTTRACGNHDIDVSKSLPLWSHIFQHPPLHPSHLFCLSFILSSQLLILDFLFFMHPKFYLWESLCTAAGNYTIVPTPGVDCFHARRLMRSPDFSNQYLMCWVGEEIVSSPPVYSEIYTYDSLVSPYLKCCWSAVVDSFYYWASALSGTFGSFLPSTVLGPYCVHVFLYPHFLNEEVRWVHPLLQTFIWRSSFFSTGDATQFHSDAQLNVCMRVVLWGDPLCPRCKISWRDRSIILKWLLYRLPVFQTLPTCTCAMNPLCERHTLSRIGSGSCFHHPFNTLDILQLRYFLYCGEKMVERHYFTIRTRSIRW